MQKFLLSIAFIFLSFYSFANDAVFYASGGTLIPVKESSISIKKEILNLTRNGDYMNVQVYFEFFNPDEAKELTVGFVTPPAGGDINDDDQDHPFVSDFMVMVDNTLLPFEIKRLNETGFTMADEEIHGNDFVYYFKINFKKGLNIVKHAYKFKGGASVMTSADFRYRLTTAKYWANGQIENFELNIDMGDNAYFSAPYSFKKNGSLAGWEIIGAGKLSVEQTRAMEKGVQMVSILNGKLCLRTQNFSPDYDLELSIYNTHLEVFLWDEDGKEHVFTKMLSFLQFYYEPDEFEDFTNEELRLLKNYFFARKGYQFKSRDLTDYFSKFNWYMPNPAIKNDLSLLNNDEQKLIMAINSFLEKQ